ncbi:HXXEE domain-containing protein [Candidatus Woesearchaeota archaeon]|nr:HXXEE domain-containing protein [Candidatus Woesearchaeota archaeon]
MAKIFVYYILLLLFHILHVIEEIFGNAYFIESFYGGLRNFLLIMILLWVIPAIILYFLLKRNKTAIYLSLVYSIIMVIDGLDHIIEFLIMGKYFNGAAGLFTGIIFLPLSILLIILLRREIYSA